MRNTEQITNTEQMRNPAGIVFVALATSLVLMTSCVTADKPPETVPKATAMQLGAFSISLDVQDIQASKDFYAKLGFEMAGGNIEQNWLILRNGSTTIGLFQGMLGHNIMTFNPGWNELAEPLENFEDVRVLQSKLQERGVNLTTEADASGDGPGSFTLVDPDGNHILVDQHLPSPK